MNLLNTKVIAVLILISFFCSGVVLAGPTGALKKGFIQNDKGEKCWYTQIVKEDNTYFHGSLKGANGIITFDNPKCMSDSGISLDVNKMMINNLISRWYSHSDADFQTRVSEMYNGSLMQKKGNASNPRNIPSSE